jgi:3-oxoadipate enol-lactonase
MPQVTNDDATLYYELHGEPMRPAVVLAHGRGGNAASWWQQLPVFARRWRLLTFDHRGFGRSRCTTRAAFDPRHFANDLRVMLDAAGIQRTALVCQSMGGRTGLGFAFKYPERVTGLVLCGTTGGLYDETIAKGLGDVRGVAANIGEFSTLALDPAFPARRPDLATLYGQIQAFNTEFDYSGPPILTATETRLDPGELAGWSIPTLVIGGENDQIVPPHVLRHVAGLIPGAALRLIPGLGHSTYFEDAATFNALVGAFLDQHARSEPR